MYMTFGDITGDATSIQHIDKIVLDTLRFGIVKRVVHEPFSDTPPIIHYPKAREIIITKKMCSASPKLAEMSYTNIPSKCTIQFTVSGEQSGIAILGTESVYATYELDNAYISEYHVDAMKGVMAEETLKISFSKISQKFTPPSSLAKSASTQYDFDTHSKEA